MVMVMKGTTVSILKRYQVETQDKPEHHNFQEKLMYIICIKTRRTSTKLVHAISQELIMLNLETEEYCY